MGCWNWFEAEHQQRDKGEPSLLAHMIREIIAGHRIDPDRVYVAGLSAGGAMAAILATTHPELFAAVGIHSGLPHAAASGVVSALMAMKHGPARRRARQTEEPGQPIPTIVFHGDQDGTVHPNNGDALIARTRWPAALAHASEAAATRTIRGEVPGGSGLHAHPAPRRHGPHRRRTLGDPRQRPRLVGRRPGRLVHRSPGSGCVWRDAALLQGASAALPPAVTAMTRTLNSSTSDSRCSARARAGCTACPISSGAGSDNPRVLVCVARPHPLRPRFRFPRPGACPALPRRLPRRARPRGFRLAEEPDGVPGCRSTSTTWWR